MKFSSFQGMHLAKEHTGGRILEVIQMNMDGLIVFGSSYTVHWLIMLSE